MQDSLFLFLLISAQLVAPTHRVPFTSTFGGTRQSYALSSESEQKERIFVPVNISRPSA